MSFIRPSKTHLKAYTLLLMIRRLRRNVFFALLASDALNELLALFGWHISLLFPHVFWPQRTSKPIPISLNETTTLPHPRVTTWNSVANL